MLKFSPQSGKRVGFVLAALMGVSCGRFWGGLVYINNACSAVITLYSNALRDAGVAPFAALAGQSTSRAITLQDEVSTYKGSGTSPNLPTTIGYNYRQIPDQAKDDDGSSGTSAKFAPRPSTDCGLSGSVTARIADCVSVNGSLATWDGTVNGNSGQDVWKLVTRNGVNKEVWQDQRTSLLWSSLVSGAANWCQASGNTQQVPLGIAWAGNGNITIAMTGNGTIGNLSAGANSITENITVTFTSATAFNVVSNVAGCQTGAISAGGLTAVPGSTVTWTAAGICSFTITQGSISGITS